MGKSSGATFSKIQVGVASKCCQMVKNDRILADERPFQHFLAILAHFMPKYTRIFENGTARLRCPSGVSRALFCRSETISKVGNIKIMSASSPFFFSPLSPPFSFSPVWFLGSWESKKASFGVVPVKMGKSSGATFSKIQVGVASKCCQMVKNDRILADERPFQHFLAILAHFMPKYTRIFENGTARLRCPSGVSRALFCRSETISKVGNIKIMSASSPFFFSPLSPPFSFLSRVVSRLVGVQKSQFRCRSGENGQIFRSHLFKNPGRCCKQMLQMVKNDRILADERPFQHFLAILAHFMPKYTRIFENGTARLRCPSGVSRALFCRSETISKVGNIKIMSASSPFFFSPLSPPFSFLSRVVSRLVGVQKSQFRCRSGENGQIFRSHLFKNPGRCCKQMLPDGEKWPNSGWWAAFSAFLGHFSPFHAKIYPDFWKRYRSVEVSERCVASTFLSFRNYLQSRQYKNYECQQSFFLLPSLPSLLFSLPCGF